MVADFFGVTTRTLMNILNEYEEEVKHNGYQIIKGQKLKEFKEMFGSLLTSIDEVSQRETDFPLSEQNSDNQSFKRFKNLDVETKTDSS